MASKLTQLNLSGHALQGAGLPPAMGRLRVLQELRVEGAQLVAVPPELAQLPLHSLFLSDNQLASPDAFAALAVALATPPALDGSGEAGGMAGRLLHLDLRGNRMSALPAALIGELPRLRELLLSRNFLRCSCGCPGLMSP